MALISCVECGNSISDKAASCPQCGAPNVPAAPPSSAALAETATTNGTTCPFSGHPIPEGASVCLCGAYYGYEDPGAEKRRQVGRIILIVCVVGLFIIPWPAKLLPVLFLLPGIAFAFQSWLQMRGGKKWWREMG
jgi:hypothetical protein